MFMKPCKECEEARERATRMMADFRKWLLSGAKGKPPASLPGVKPPSQELPED